MTDTIKQYLTEKNIDSLDKLAKHIEQLKVNTFPDKLLIRDLISVLEEDQLGLLSFFAEIYKNPVVIQRTVNIHFIDEVLDKIEDNKTTPEIKYSYKITPEKSKQFYQLDGTEYTHNGHPFFITMSERDLNTTLFYNESFGRFFTAEKGTPDNIAAGFTDYLHTMQDSKQENISRDHSENITRFHKIPVFNTDWMKTPEYEQWNKDRLTDTLVGKKESAGKTNYSEIDWTFVKQLSERMSAGKNKYPKNNWKKKVNVEELKQSLLRHTLAVVNGEYEDDNRTMGHLEAIALNAQFINYQLLNYPEKLSLDLDVKM